MAEDGATLVRRAKSRGRDYHHQGPPPPGRREGTAAAPIIRTSAGPSTGTWGPDFITGSRTYATEGASPQVTADGEDSSVSAGVFKSFWRSQCPRPQGSHHHREAMERQPHRSRVYTTDGARAVTKAGNFFSHGPKGARF